MGITEAFPAGEQLADELEARGWTQSDLAEVMGRPTQFVSEIITGKKEITRESAAQLGAALGTSAELWLNLQDSYLLWRQSQDKSVQENLDAVASRARLRTVAPVSLLVNRGFVTATDLEGQSREVLGLLGMTSFDDTPSIEFAARRSNSEEDVTGLQRAWVSCVKRRAQERVVEPYSSSSLNDAARGLSGMSRDPEVFVDFPNVLAQAGVKLVYEEAFPGGKLDGCAMWVNGTPIIGISGRGKRLDKVLFTLLHECAHVLLGHLDLSGRVIVDDLNDEHGDVESDADRLACEFAIADELPEVPARVDRRWAQNEAERLGVHPIVLVGRLQKEGRLSWSTTLARGAPTVTEQLRRWNEHAAV